MTRADILAAIARFDETYPNTNDYDSWLDKDNYTKAVEHNDRLYPCKWLVAEVMGVPRVNADFDGRSNGHWGSKQRKSLRLWTLQQGLAVFIIYSHPKSSQAW
ncbi:MAG TPA: hypothetical protein VKA46_23835, partial [Gemmataceae bacterium]|nr:hypothetical protein [Gemmataceae bacterium]